MEAAREDFLFISRLPGRKVVIKGNHDYWWSTAAKAYKFFDQNGIDNIEILNNNCVLYGGIALCGTRGWFYEEERGGEHDRKIMLREVGRLETSLKCAGEREKLVFLHYPPKYMSYQCRRYWRCWSATAWSAAITATSTGAASPSAFEGRLGNTEFRLVSADAVDFRPVRVLA